MAARLPAAQRVSEGSADSQPVDVSGVTPAGAPGAGTAITVQVCHAPPPPALPFMQTLQVAPGTTLKEAVQASALAKELPAVQEADLRTGIWGKLRPGETVLRENDRIELYRPLVADPKESRRRRAKEKPAK